MLKMITKEQTPYVINGGRMTGQRGQPFSYSSTLRMGCSIRIVTDIRPPLEKRTVTPSCLERLRLKPYS